jgi:hypothetical protein
MLPPCPAGPHLQLRKEDVEALHCKLIVDQLLATATRVKRVPLRESWWFGDSVCFCKFTRQVCCVSRGYLQGFTPSGACSMLRVWKAIHQRVIPQMPVLRGLDLRPRCAERITHLSSPLVLPYRSYQAYPARPSRGHQLPCLSVQLADFGRIIQDHPARAMPAAREEPHGGWSMRSRRAAGATAVAWPAFEGEISSQGSKYHPRAADLKA